MWEVRRMVQQWSLGTTERVTSFGAVALMVFGMR